MNTVSSRVAFIYYVITEGGGVFKRLMHDYGGRGEVGLVMT